MPSIGMDCETAASRDGIQPCYIEGNMGMNSWKGGERKSGHANGMMVNGKYDMVMKGVGNE